MVDDSMVNSAGQYPDSNIRTIPQQALLRMLELKGHWQKQ